MAFQPIFGWGKIFLTPPPLTIFLIRFWPLWKKSRFFVYFFSIFIKFPRFFHFLGGRGKWPILNPWRRRVPSQMASLIRQLMIIWEFTKKLKNIINSCRKSAKWAWILAIFQAQNYLKFPTFGYFLAFFDLKNFIFYFENRSWMLVISAIFICQNFYKVPIRNIQNIREFCKTWA